MATIVIADFQDYLTPIPAVHRAPQHAVWRMYDEGANALYVNFKKPSHAAECASTRSVNAGIHLHNIQRMALSVARSSPFTAQWNRSRTLLRNE